MFVVLLIINAGPFKCTGYSVWFRKAEKMHAELEFAMQNNDTRLCDEGWDLTYRRNVSWCFLAAPPFCGIEGERDCYFLRAQ